MEVCATQKGESGRMENQTRQIFLFHKEDYCFGRAVNHTE
jgi:hypothetical protein